MTIAVSLDNVSRHYGEVRALDQISLDIEEGEFFALLGPSGSGKTTCLRLIAGFDQPTSGTIRLFGESVENTPPYRRHVNTVFQDYALFPHLSVLDNVAYGPMIQGVDRGERTRAAQSALELVRLPGYGDRKPAELSGGQRQRVALARAIVNQPRVLLLDEPLGALDLKLREEMQEELKELQQTLGISFVFVTHDQGEALSMADRIAIFNEGHIVQVDSPRALYQKPKNRFVANFVGSSNVLPGSFVGIADPNAMVSLRPEAIHVVADGGRAAVVTGIAFLGSTNRVSLDSAGQPLQLQLPVNQRLPEKGETIRIAWQTEDIHRMSSDS